MRRLKYIVSGMLLLMCFLLPITASAFPNEKNGFRDLAFGTDFETVKSEMIFIHQHALYDHLKYYHRKNEELMMGRAKLKAIEYRFWFNKLYEVKITPENDSEWYALKDAVFANFGPGKLKQGSGYYEWESKSVRMVLRHIDLSEYPDADRIFGNVLNIQSSTLAEEMLAREEALKKSQDKKARF